MRCLKIPNTKHFHDITTIADAQALYGRIKDTLKQVWGWDGGGSGWAWVVFFWCGVEGGQRGGWWRSGSSVRDAIHPPRHY